MRLVISAGEASGDFLAAHLVQQLKKHHPNIVIAGIAGPKMVAEGVIPWFDLNELNVMGLQEVISQLPRLWKLRRHFRQKIIDWQPDAFIGVDAPDFNLGLARDLKASGLLTIHYVSPSIWAWRAKRAKKIAQSVDQLLTLFPFEPALYKPYGLDARFVGHPLADAIASQTSDVAKNEIAKKKTSHIGLLPGSRWGEVCRHVPLLLDTVEKMAENHPSMTWVMPVVSKDQQSKIYSVWGARIHALQIEVTADQTRKTLEQVDVALTASGTVTLETFLMGVPQVVFYRLAPATHWIAKQLNLVKSQWISLPNILSGTEVVPEFIQQQANADNLAVATLQWLSNPQRQRCYQEKASHWRAGLMAKDQAAKAILDRVQQKC